jgi:hypothetical protein
VRWRLFDLNVTAAREENLAASSKQLEDAIQQALAEVRTERLRKPV